MLCLALTQHHTVKFHHLCLFSAIAITYAMHNSIVHPYRTESLCQNIILTNIPIAARIAMGPIAFFSCLSFFTVFPSYIYLLTSFIASQRLKEIYYKGQTSPYLLSYHISLDYANNFCTNFSTPDLSLLGQIVPKGNVPNGTFFPLINAIYFLFHDPFPRMQLPRAAFLALGLALLQWIAHLQST